MSLRSGLSILILCAARLGAQTVPEAPVPAVADPAAEAPLVMPVNTLVPMVLLQDVSTATSKPDDFFDLCVTKDVLIHGRVTIPAKTLAVGQVIDSQPGRMGGAAAKLLVTIRYVEVDGQRIGLRLHHPSSGEDKTKSSLALAMVFGALGLVVKGGNVVLPAGTELLAKVAKDTPIQPVNPNQTATPVALPEKETQP